MTCVGFYPTSAAAIQHLAPEILKLASADSTHTVGLPTLRLGSTGEEVKLLQTKLKQLGYYNDLIDGLYGDTTNQAVSKFQGAKGLRADGVYGTQTREKLEAIASKKLLLSATTSFTPESKIKQEGEQQDLIWWLLVSMVALGIFGSLLFLIKWYGNLKKDPKSETSNLNQTKLVTPSSQQLDTTTPPPTELLPLETTSRLAKVNIVDELMKELHSPDPTQRRKAI
ncbi:MAG: peptidoglycan-binding protein [Stigonema ocellatum SAG 48.90 = DSM 106950]|nr:peptidoglycan-binding protein [Stigonema ocellatum SAG 48.90 = DSM 106950]